MKKLLLFTKPPLRRSFFKILLILIYISIVVGFSHSSHTLPQDAASEEILNHATNMSGRPEAKEVHENNHEITFSSDKKTNNDQQ